MTKNLDSTGLRSIVENYDLFFVDLWGVVHNGIKLNKNAIETLVEISKAKKNYVLLTNAPRPNNIVKIFLAKMGMDNDKIPPVVFTSFSLMFGTVILSVLSAKDIKAGTNIPLRASILMIGAGMSSGFAVMFLLLSLDRATVTLVSPIAALNPIVTLTLAYFLLQRLELITKKVVIGTFVAVGGVILVIIGSA